MVSKKENGQTIVLIAIVMIGLIAMAALIVDGGNAYFNRRNAQTAADAGALAGAYEYCTYGNDPTSVITEYVEVQNGATLDQWYFESDTNYIVVETSIEQNNFFAKLIGLSTTTVKATASAGCFSPGVGSGLLPIAWACQNPDAESSVWSESDQCNFKAITYEELQSLIYGPYGNGTPGPVTVGDGTYTAPFAFRGAASSMLPELYVIMASTDIETDLNKICEPTGYMNCDINGDNIPDFQGSGDTSWIDLDGGGGSLDPAWITEGFDGKLAPHYWIPSQTGVNTNIYINAITQKIDQIVLVPVFNSFCNGHPFSTPGCIDAAHIHISPPSAPLVEYEVPTTASSPIYYHLAGFGAFFVACVDQSSLGDDGDCPGHRAAVAAGILKDNINTVEGYFVTGVPMNTSGGVGGIDLGVYVLSLTD